MARPMAPRPRCSCGDPNGQGYAMREWVRLGNEDYDTCNI